VILCGHAFQPDAPLSLGAHTFEVTATDTASNLSPIPVRRAFRVIEVAEEHPIEEPPKPVEPVSPELRLRASHRKDKLRVNVTLNPAVTGSIALAVSGRHARIHLSRHLSLTIRAGVATASVRVPAEIARLRVAVSYEGDTKYTSASAFQTVRRARQP
jgi:hypothetical protein